MKVSEEILKEFDKRDLIDQDTATKLAEKVRLLENSLDLVTREYLQGAGEIYLETIMNRSRLDHLGPGTTIQSVRK